MSEPNNPATGPVCVSRTRASTVTGVAKGERPLPGLTSGGGEPLGEPGETRSPERKSGASASPEGQGPALFVLGHGSRDPRAGTEFDRLVATVRSLMPATAVGSGVLELAEPPVDAALDALVAGGAADVVVVPVVLFGAGHLKDDGPAVLGRARRRHPTVRFRLARDLGIHPAVLAVAEDRARAAAATLKSKGTAAAAVVMVGRGSTDPDACADLVKLARLIEDGRGLGPVQAAFVAMSLSLIHI